MLQSEGIKSTDTITFQKDFTVQPTYQPISSKNRPTATLGHQTPLRLDNIIVVTRSTKQQHTEKLESRLKRKTKAIEPVKRNQNSIRKRQYGQSTRFCKISKGWYKSIESKK